MRWYSFSVDKDLISLGLGRFLFGMFFYWIGFGYRDLGVYRVIDFGFFKVMWTPKEKGGDHV